MGSFFTTVAFRPVYARCTDVSASLQAAKLVLEGAKSSSRVSTEGEFLNRRTIFVRRLTLDHPSSIRNHITGPHFDPFGFASSYQLYHRVLPYLNA